MILHALLDSKDDEAAETLIQAESTLRYRCGSEGIPG
jgi:hypothetical protein